MKKELKIKDFYSIACLEYVGIPYITVSTSGTTIYFHYPNTEAVQTVLEEIQQAGYLVEANRFSDALRRINRKIWRTKRKVAKKRVYS